MGPDS